MIFFANPKSEYIYLKKKIDNKIKQVLNSNSYILGKEVENFEKKFSKYLRVKYSVGVSNGTDAIILALQAINIISQLIHHKSKKKSQKKLKLLLQFIFMVIQ